MLIVVVIGVLAIAAGWLIGRPRALVVTIVVPIAAVISRVQQEHSTGHPPETWTEATVLFTIVFALLVLAGVLLRRVTGPAHVIKRR